MNADLISAQESLKIKCVNLRELKVYIKDDIYPETIDLSEVDRQSYSSPDRVRENELIDEDDSSRILWNYRFDHALGIRLVDPNIEIEEDSDSDENGQHVLIEIVATFEANYFSQVQLTEEQVRIFSDMNSGFHVWPYWRELVQTTCNRIGMTTPLDIPTYKVKHQRNDD